MQILLDTPVGEIVKNNYKTATLFQAHRIDYCCGGNQSISDACYNAGVVADEFISRLEELLQESDPDSEYINNLELGVLSDYIVNRHHAYVHKHIPFLKENLDKVADAHGANHPEMIQVRDLFYGSAGELTMHMQKEEILLFPYVKKLEEAKAGNQLKPESPFGTVANPIASMKEEHQNEGERYERISHLTNGYQVPVDGCTTYQVTMKQLSDFEKDLHRHIHLENNILFPKAIKLEENF